jgi:hypothetical protein
VTNPIGTKSGEIPVAPSPEAKLIECREMLFAASQTLYTIAAVLKDREMPATSSSANDLGSMLGEFSLSIEQVEA